MRHVPLVEQRLYTSIGKVIPILFLVVLIFVAIVAAAAAAVASRYCRQRCRFARARAHANVCPQHLLL